jgi:anti-anti-sigma factor
LTLPGRGDRSSIGELAASRVILSPLERGVLRAQCRVALLTPSTLKITVSRAEGRWTVRAAGDVDQRTAACLRDALHWCTPGPSELVVVDLAGVGLLSAAALTVLVQARHHANAAGARLLWFVLP